MSSLDRYVPVFSLLEVELDNLLDRQSGRIKKALAEFDDEMYIEREYRVRVRETSESYAYTRAISAEEAKQIVQQGIWDGDFRGREYEWADVEPEEAVLVTPSSRRR